jgi:hypothetical protein
MSKSRKRLCVIGVAIAALAYFLRRGGHSVGA